MRNLFHMFPKNWVEAIRLARELDGLIIDARQLSDRRKKEQEILKIIKMANLYRTNLDKAITNSTDNIELERLKKSKGAFEKWMKQRKIPAKD